MTTLLPPDVQSPKTDVFGAKPHLFNKMNGDGNSNKIYVANDHEGYTLSIVIASQQREAEIYWQGKGIIAFNVEVIDPSKIDTPLGILEILKTRKVRIKDGFPGLGKEIVAVDKR